MESRYVDILVIIDYINMTMYALKIHKEGTRIENSHHQRHPYTSWLLSF